MMKIINKLMDSDDDMDDLPLKYVSSIQKKYSCIEELKSYSIHACEFCEKKFNNRYDYLIHNSKHIIIPLIKLLPHYCAECRRYFLTDEDMNDHNAVEHKANVIKKHNNNIATETNTSQEIKIETVLNMKDLHEDDKPLSILSKKETGNNTQKDNILENFIISCKVDIEKIKTPWLVQSNINEVHNHKNFTEGDDNSLEIKTKTVTDTVNIKEGDITIPVAEPLTCGTLNKVIDKDKVEYNNHVTKFKRLAHEFNTRNYEGEFENYLLKVKTPLKHNVTSIVEDIKNHVAHLESPVNHNTINGHVDISQVIEDKHVFSDASQFHDEEKVEEDEEYDYDDPIIILAPVKKEIMPSYSSVHFDELVKPGMFHCKRCLLRYPTRYDVVIHEAEHLDMSKAYLNWSKTKHKNREHASTSTPVVTPECKPVSHYQDDIIKEGLTSKNSSEFHCDACTTSFNGTKLWKAHRAVCNGEATVTLCNACLYFRDRPKNVQFYSISKLDKKEEGLQCHWCGQVTADMSLVNVKTKLVVKKKGGKNIKKLADRITFESSTEKDDSKSSGVSKITKCGSGKSNPIRKPNISGHIAKPLSNRERLKLIQNRLKLMKR